MIPHCREHCLLLERLVVMNKLMFLLAFGIITACGSGGGLVAEVTNETDLERSSETVEIAWGDLRRAGVTADNVVVTTEDGEQIPSQVIFDSAGEPVTLLFQATVAPASSTSYRIEAGAAGIRALCPGACRRLCVGEQPCRIPHLRPGTRRSADAGDRRMGQVDAATRDKRVVRPQRLSPQLRRGHGLLQGGIDAGRRRHGSRRRRPYRADGQLRHAALHGQRWPSLRMPLCV